ncbi:hypothetical protein MP228_010575 [Amoeboaphelidium protococcarum]|nr:hypothetical protein MP228_010575 [Amoeboaphelidium protococcarum]
MTVPASEDVSFAELKNYVNCQTLITRETAFQARRGLWFIKSHMSAYKAHASSIAMLTTETTIKFVPGQHYNFLDWYDAEETEELLKLDPLQWKSQDHYAVLGLDKLRYNASANDIKKAYRMRVLKHHPDKMGADGQQQQQQQQQEDNFFKCIQRAYELLSDPVKRRQFDSVDPKFDNSIPSASQVHIAYPQQFFEIFGPVFERNAHFSKVEPVPAIGDLHTPRSAVNQFYKFWTSFDSWRSFEMLDKEMQEEVENRDERRWLEKQNKADRAKRKKEESARLIKLVDLAMKFDPRLTAFKEYDAQQKVMKKKQKKQQAGAPYRVEREQKEAAEKLEQLKLKEQQDKMADLKKQKEQRKKEIKNMRRSIRSQVADHLDNDASHIADELILSLADDLEALQGVNKLMSECGEPQALLDVLQSEYKRVKGVDAKAAGVKQVVQEDKVSTQVDGSNATNNAESEKAKTASEEPRKWTAEEMKVLVKAVNQFPGGTLDRWETIADYVAAHSSCPKRKAAEIIKTVNDLKRGAVMPTQLHQAEEQSSPHQNASANDASIAEGRPWSQNEQKQLELALKQYPASAFKSSSDRWSKIAEVIENRSKQEIVDRVKEVVKSMKNGKK